MIESQVFQLGLKYQHLNGTDVSQLCVAGGLASDADAPQITTILFDFNID